MGGWDQEKLRALQFLPVKNSEATTSLPRSGDDFSDVDMSVVEDEDNMECGGKEKGFSSVEKQDVPSNLENVKLSLSNMYADPKAVKNMLKHKQFLQKKNTSFEEFKGLENQPLNQPQQMFPVQMHKSFEDEMRRKLEASAERNPKGKDILSWAQRIQPGAGQEMIISISPETLSPQINSPEQIEETNKQVRGLGDDNSTSDEDIQIEDLGEVSGSETEGQRGQNLKIVKVMLNRIIIDPTSHQGLTVDQLFEEAEMSPPGSYCVSCSFCQADIRKEDLDAHQVSIQLPVTIIRCFGHMPLLPNPIFCGSHIASGVKPVQAAANSRLLLPFSATRKHFSAESKSLSATRKSLSATRKSSIYQQPS